MEEPLKAARAKPSERELAAAFCYLDVLRESGATNMYGAASYVMRDMGRTREQAVQQVTLWMKTFSTEPARTRAKAARHLLQAEGGSTP